MSCKDIYPVEWFCTIFMLTVPQSSAGMCLVVAKGVMLLLDQRMIIINQ